MMGKAFLTSSWAKEGNHGWDYANLLPYFKQFESYPEGGSGRGKEGPIKIRKAAAAGLAPWLAAWQKAGLPFLEVGAD